MDLLDYLAEIEGLTEEPDSEFYCNYSDDKEYDDEEYDDEEYDDEEYDEESSGILGILEASKGRILKDVHLSSMRDVNENEAEEPICNNVDNSNKDNANRFLLIVDGSSLLSTSFYGTARDLMFAKTEEQKQAAYKKLMKSSDGRYTNGVYTFMKTLLKIINEQKPSHMAIVWDVTRNSFRKTELYSDYKGTRKETPNPLKEQFKTTQELLNGVLPQFMSSLDDERIYEADDFAGSLGKRFEEKIPCRFLSKDEDYLQLVSEYSSVYLVTSKHKELYEEMGIDREMFNLPDGVFEYTLESLEAIKELKPYQIVDYKALCGDSSDNIPGVKGVGPKAVLPLLKEYDTVEGIYEEIEGLDEKEQKELAKFFKDELSISRSPIKKLLEGREAAFLSKELATIKTDIPSIQELTLDSLRVDVDEDLLKQKLLDLDIKSLLK